MKAIMVMFDSLNRHMLPPYGCDWMHAPNFQRLAEKTATFDRCYVGSMPCMPARRELHTGRYNFLHRSWGPIEPFDDSMPQLLKQNGVSSHLVSDHYHYWEDGGATYHQRYSTWRMFRGQEGDAWMGQADPPEIPPHVGNRGGRCWEQDWVNRQFMTREEDLPQPRTFAAGMDFIRRNHHADNWFLHIETFDPHEPFYTLEKYKKLYPHAYDGPHFDWPDYGPVRETPEQVEHCRYEYAALVSMCDEHLGEVLDMMDALDLWKDTMLIVNTDHGFLLGEHDAWAKCWLPFYEEHAHTPLFIHDPRCPGAAGQRRGTLVQTIDLPATLLEFFGVDRPADMQGVPLAGTIADDAPVREAALFGLFGAHVNVTDGRYVYMRAPKSTKSKPLHQYTHMPTHMTSPFSVDEMRRMKISRGFGFTKGCPVMKIPGWAWIGDERVMKNWLWDIHEDPRQQAPLDDPKIERMMIDHLDRLMKANDAPREQWKRLGL